MRVEVQLEPAVAVAIREYEAASGHDERASTSSRSVRQILDALQPLGATLEPVHRGATHPLLTPWFYISAGNAAVAESIVEALRECPGVESAYVKPSDELP